MPASPLPKASPSVADEPSVKRISAPQHELSVMRNIKHCVEAMMEAIEETMRVHRESLLTAESIACESIRKVHASHCKGIEDSIRLQERYQQQEMESVIEELKKQNVELQEGCQKEKIKNALYLVHEDSIHAIDVLDEVIGLQVNQGDGTMTGTRQIVRDGLQLLPLWMVRGLEYEAAGRRVGLDAFILRLIDPIFVNESITSHKMDGRSVICHLKREEYHKVGFAKWAIGSMYTIGAPGLQKDPGESVRYLKDAVLLGNADAAYSLGCVAERLTKDATGARKWYELAVSWGHGLAANNLASLLLQGPPEIPVDATAALQNFLLAIERGERIYAPMNLGELYLSGAPGVQSDPGEAAKYLLLALSEGDSIARLGARKSMQELISVQERKENPYPSKSSYRALGELRSPSDKEA